MSLALLFQYLLLNMFRMLVHPSSGASDIKLFYLYSNIRLQEAQTSKPSGHYIYRQFNIHQLYVLHTQCVYVFCVDLRTAIISLYSIN